MSKIGELVSAIQEELSGSPTALKELLQYTHSLAEVFPVATKLRPVQQFHLLEGLLHAQPELFLQRMIEASDQKQALAAYCFENCGLRDEINRFVAGETTGFQTTFFESGSTIAHLIGHFAGRLSEAQNKVHTRLRGGAAEMRSGAERPRLKSPVITNNFTGVTALAGLVDQLEPVQGRLSLKYFGFFPFQDVDEQVPWQLEAKRYNRLAEDIEHCDAVFATCSSFSFLAGPIVGSRANCLTKRAMYSGAVKWDEQANRNFHLLFHFKKLVPMADTYEGLGAEKPEMPGSHCGCVFIPARDHRTSQALDKWLVSHDDADRVNKESFKRSWHGLWREVLDAKRLYSTTISIPLEDFAKGVLENRVRVSHQLDQSWLDWLNSSTGTNILIALPHDQAAEALKCIESEVRHVNRVVKSAEFRFQFKIRNSESASKELVAHIVLEERKTASNP